MRKRFILSALCLFASFGHVCGQARHHSIDSLHPDVHDPVMAKGEDGRYYLFSTGMNVGVISSADMKIWQAEPDVFKTTPRWAMEEVKGYRGHTWAPDISYHNGLWHLYYSCSTFGKNSSAIGLAVNKTLDPLSPDFGWTDRGMVIASHKGRDPFNAIDPNLIVDSKGQPYLTFGSFWDGIQLVKLSKKDFQTPLGKPVTISRRMPKKFSLAELNDKSIFTVEGRDTIEAGPNAVEAPFIFRHGDYYYLFVSFDFCCRGERSTYKTVYGRSKKITGPYVDRDGKTMTEGGGTVLYGPDSNYFGIGHNAAYEWDGQCYFLSHAYEKAQNGRAKLFLRPLRFDQEGWIVKDNPPVQTTVKPRRQSMQWFESVKSPEISENGDVTFRLFAPKAEKVLLSCQACPTTPMTWDDDDQAWKVTIHPQMADIYPYNFIVDGMAVSDPANKELFPNELFKSSLLIMPNPDMPYTERNIPHGQVHYLTYYSTVMDETRTVLVYTPADYDKDTKRKFPVYYLVSGTTDTEETWYKAGRANFILDNLIHDGKANKMIVVMPYGNMNTGNPRLESNAADATYDLFSQEMEQCVMPLVEQSFRTRNEREDRAIGGFSRGAGEALYTAFKLSDRFASVCAYSGYLTHEAYEQRFPQLIGNPAKTNSDYRLIWFGIGTDDFLLEGVRKNKELFKQRGVHFEEFETTGGHTWMNARKFLYMTAQKLFSQP